MGSPKIASILLSLLGSSTAAFHNVTKLGGYQEVNFPLQSGKIHDRMVIVDSRQVSWLYIYLHVLNTFVQYSGQRVKLACVNWYGFHLNDLVINGLDRDAFHGGLLFFLAFNKLVLELYLWVKHLTELLDLEYCRMSFEKCTLELLWMPFRLK